MTAVIYLSWSILFLVLTSIISVTKGRANSVFSGLLLLSAFFSLIYIVGFRPIAIAGDTARYLYVFSQLSEIKFAWGDGFDLYGNDELLFWPFAAALKEIGLDGRDWLILIVCWFFLFTLISYKRFLKDQPWVVVFVSLFLTYHLVFLNSVRQSMVECLVLLAYAMMLKGMRFNAFLIIIFASFFHTSAYFALPLLLLPIDSIKYSVKFVATMLATALLASPLFSLVTGSIGEDLTGGVASKIDSYVIEENANEYSDLWGLRQFQLVVLFSSIYVLVFSLIKNRDKVVLYNWVFYYLALLLFTSMVPVVSGRLMQYLSIIFPIIVWDLMSLLLNGEKHKIIFFSVFFFVLGCLVFMNESAQIVLGL